jgi:hypothetical protein
MKCHAALLALVAAAVLGACDAGRSLQDSEPAVTTAADRSAAEASGAPKFWETNAAADWDEYAVSLTPNPAVDPYRMHTYLTLAQLRAAEAAGATEPHPPVHGAIAGASAAVLASFFPARAAEIETRLVTQATAAPWPGAKQQDFAAGVALGRQVAAQVLAYAAGDRVGVANPGLPPSGPGYWIFNGALVRGFYGARTFFLTSGNEFPPAAPPAFGSPAFESALQEVADIAASRTQEQVDIANYWNVNQSGRSHAAWNRLAISLLRKYRVKETESARILFLMNAASFDALAGCFEAKFQYWYIRPPQARAIATVFPAPPHPSYPSAHSCVSGASSQVLAARFPSEAGMLEDKAIEASLSRLYAGIHYRFDMEAGLELGRHVAAKALATDLATVAAQN